MHLSVGRKKSSPGLPLVLRNAALHFRTRKFVFICATLQVYISVKSAQIPLSHSDEMTIPGRDTEIYFSIPTMDQSDFTYEPKPGVLLRYSIRKRKPFEYNVLNKTISSNP